MWCPKCKHEYREGVTVCADCGSELVDSLPEEPEAEAPEDLISAEFLAALKAGMEQEQQQAEDSEPEEEPFSSAGVYLDSTDRAEENRSSAWTDFYRL